MKEAILIQRCIQGDRAAQRWLFDEYYNYVYTIGYRYLNHHQDTEDVVSEVFRRVYKNLDSVSDTRDQGLKRWIQTITINEALRFLRQKQPVDYTEDHRLLELPINAETTHTLHFDAKIVRKAIQELPIGYRTIFLLNTVEGLSHTEIAKHLNISRNTSKSQMLKAKKYLQNKLNKDASRQF
jgi:RNA polymerase sigma-70 factor (ECF subfamily)